MPKRSRVAVASRLRSAFSFSCASLAHRSPGKRAEVTTDHFAIYYESRFGTRTASEDYARLVANSLEEAYDALVSAA